MGHVEIMWPAVCSLAPYSHFAEEVCCQPTVLPVRRRLSLTQAVLVELIPIGLVMTLGL